jgi:hypothetical protein
VRRPLTLLIVVALLCGALTPVVVAGQQDAGNTTNGTTATSTATSTPTATPGLATTPATTLTATATSTPTPAPTPTSTATPVPPNADDGPPTAEFSLRELRYTGEIVDPRYPSLRVAGESVAFWSVSYPPTGFNSYGAGSAETKYLASNVTVHRNKVRLFATHPFDGEDHQYDATVVYWNPETRSTGPNGNQTERVANVTRTGTQMLSFGPGFKRHDDLKLAGYYDGTRRVTVFLADQDGERVGQWTFKQASIKSAQPVNIDSRGELWSWVMWWVFLPSLAGVGIVGFLVPKWRKSAGAGPNRMGTMLGAGLLIGGVSLTVGYYALTSLVAAIPIVIPATITYLVATILINDTSDVRSVELWQFDTMNVTSPVDPEAFTKDIVDGRNKTVSTIEMPNGETAVYKTGFGPFIARLNGFYAEFSVDNVRSRIEMGGNPDEIVVVDQALDELIDHVPEGILFRWPWRSYNSDDLPDDPDDIGVSEYRKASVLPDSLGVGNYIATGILAAIIGGACFGSHQYLGSWMWGVAVVVPIALFYAEPVDGYATTVAARGHARSALANMFYADFEMNRTSTLDELMEEVGRMNRQVQEARKYAKQKSEQSIIDKANDQNSTPFDADRFDKDPGKVNPDDESSKTPTGADD